MFKFNKKYSLLPFVRKNLYGLNRSYGQYIGWEIIKFNIQDNWKKSMGEGVTVAVIDTGCDIYHEDLKNNIIDGKNILNENKDPIDDNGHGTHVASTIIAQNNNIGMLGVAPKSKVRPVKVLDKHGNGSSNNIIKGLEWSINQNVDIITMSLGSKYNETKIYDLIKKAYQKNILIFCAAGNSGENQNILYPARYKETIAIGAIDNTLNRTSFTCSGEDLDFLAPGHDIFGAVPGNKYAMMSGTSMSNPFAVGCACLLISHLKQSGESYSVETIKNYFKKNTLEVSDPKHRSKKYQGYGIIRPI